MASPESYRPMSKIARKNSLQQSQTPSARGRMKSLESGTSSLSVQRSLSTNSAKRRPSTAVAVMRGRSQSVVMTKSPSMTSNNRPGSPPTTTSSRISTSSRSRPTSPTTKRPPSRADVLNINKSVKNKKTKAGRKLSGTVRKSSCVVGNLDTAAGNGGNHQQQIQASTSSSTPIKKKKPVKRIIQ